MLRNKVVSHKVTEASVVGYIICSRNASARLSINRTPVDRWYVHYVQDNNSDLRRINYPIRPGG